MPVFEYGQEELFFGGVCRRQAIWLGQHPGRRVAYQRRRQGVVEKGGRWNRGEPVSLVKAALDNDRTLPQLTRAVVLDSVIKRHVEVPGPGLPAELGRGRAGVHDLEAGKERLPVPWRLDDVDAIMSCLAGLVQKRMAGCDRVGMCSSPGYAGMGSRLTGSWGSRANIWQGHGASVAGA